MEVFMNGLLLPLYVHLFIYFPPLFLLLSLSNTNMLYSHTYCTQKYVWVYTLTYIYTLTFGHLLDKTRRLLTRFFLPF